MSYRGRCQQRKKKKSRRRCYFIFAYPFSLPVMSFPRHSDFQHMFRLSSAFHLVTFAHSIVFDNLHCWMKSRLTMKLWKHMNRAPIAMLLLNINTKHIAATKDKLSSERFPFKTYQLKNRLMPEWFTFFHFLRRAGIIVYHQLAISDPHQAFKLIYCSSSFLTNAFFAVHLCHGNYFVPNCRKFIRFRRDSKRWRWRPPSTSHAMITFQILNLMSSRGSLTIHFGRFFNYKMFSLQTVSTLGYAAP